MYVEASIGKVWNGMDCSRVELNCCMMMVIEIHFGWILGGCLIET
jgi:hypothetical protein